MKIKVRLSEGFDTWILKESIEIDTSIYPELKDMEDEQEVLEFLQKNSNKIEYRSPDTQEPEEGWSLFDELYNQDAIRNKETNYETHIHIDNED